jgi:hypothetical protein
VSEKHGSHALAMMLWGACTGLNVFLAAQPSAAPLFRLFYAALAGHRLRMDGSLRWNIDPGRVSAMINNLLTVAAIASISTCIGYLGAMLIFRKKSVPEVVAPPTPPLPCVHALIPIGRSTDSLRSTGASLHGRPMALREMRTGRECLVCGELGADALFEKGK